MAIDSDHPATEAPEQLLRNCDVRRLRRSGPGGQHRNKVETAVAVHHRPTGVSAEASERRSQAENQRMALKRLRLNLALDVRRPAERTTAVSELWQSRCRGGRIRVNPEHEDFPSLLAEALDVIAAREWDLKAAAESLECTATQLVKFLKNEPRALALVNRHRRELGMHVLK